MLFYRKTAKIDKYEKGTPYAFLSKKESSQMEIAKPPPKPELEKPELEIRKPKPKPKPKLIQPKLSSFFKKI